MKIKAILILASLASFISSAAAATPGGTPASDNKTTATAPVAADKAAQTARRDLFPLRGVVVSVSPTLLVLKGGKDKPQRKFEITGDTKITKDDHPAATSDATEGQQVTGYVNKNEGGNPRLVSLNLSPKQKEKSADSKAVEKKGDAGPEKKK